MKIDENGNYIIKNNDVNDIDFYIEEFISFNNTLSALLRKDPETRTAIIDCRYKDLLCLRVQAYQTKRKLDMLFNNKILQADSYEAACAAGEHPATYGND